MKVSFTMSLSKSLLLLCWIFSVALAQSACTCNNVDENVRSFNENSTEQVFSNLATEIAFIGGYLIPGTLGEPHKMGMLQSVMYEAYAANGANDWAPLTEAGMIRKQVVNTTDEDEIAQFVAHTAYGCIRRLISGADEKIALLDTKMQSLGFNSPSTDILMHESAPLVMGVLQKFMPGPSPDINIINAPSNTSVNACEGLVNAARWQALCVHDPQHPAECKTQDLSFGPLYDARLIVADGERQINDLIAQAAIPGAELDSSSEEFIAQHRAVLEASAHLDDLAKFQAEHFQPNAVALAHSMILEEIEARGLSLEESILVLFGTIGAARDAVAGSVTIKLNNQSVRPITVAQCQFRGVHILGWNKPYMGVRNMTNNEGDLWTPYLPTPPHPSYTSGHAGAAGAAMAALKRFFPDGLIQGANCATRKAGTSRYEPKIEAGQPGYIANVTDVPNQGPGTVGYSPAQDVTICTASFDDYAEQIAESRLLGGIHVPMDNHYGLQWGRYMGNHFYETRVVPLLPADEPEEEEPATCSCNNDLDSNARQFNESSTEPVYSNLATEAAFIGTYLIPGTLGEPHKLGMLQSVMYEAYAANGANDWSPLTEAGMIRKKLITTTDEDEIAKFVGHAAFGCIRRLISGADEKIALLDAKMKSLGFNSADILTHESAALVMGVLQKFMPGPSPDFNLINTPSNTSLTNCDGLVDGSRWQPLCVYDPQYPGKCKAQELNFGPLYDARLIVANGGRQIKNLIQASDVGSAILDDSSEEFISQHRSVMAASAQLDDMAKFQAEHFQRNAVVLAHKVILDEVEARGLSLEDSVLVLFGTIGAARDAVAGSVTMKLDSQSVRPITVAQCHFHGEETMAWNKPYMGVHNITNSEGDLWRSYLPTPAHPAYTSGHAAAAGAAMAALKRFFPDGLIQGANCARRKAGTSTYEPKIEAGQPGYISGVTDVPNQGPRTIGYSPAADVIICTATFDDYVNKVAASQVLGGVHIPMDDVNGQKFGEFMGNHFYNIRIAPIFATPSPSATATALPTRASPPTSAPGSRSFSAAFERGVWGVVTFALTMGWSMM
ncbi:unnamed protein product [Cylindrotheca closterium]|uniref:Subtilisin n=1 Tax=Cylindrotheca closterium TaxID=2856 RepID=A0AAD2PUP4_9STRA|nr:unnamed protein product [Cylindrotheca closterium]